MGTSRMGGGGSTNCLGSLTFDLPLNMNHSCLKKHLKHSLHKLKFNVHTVFIENLSGTN